MLKQIIYNLLEFISPAMVVIAFAFLRHRSLATRQLRVLFVYFLLASVNLGVATYLAVYDISNLFWYNLNGFCSLLSLSVFFYGLVQAKRYKQAISILSVTGLGAYLVMLYFWSDNTAFFSSGYAVSSLLIILYCLLFLNEAFIHKSMDANYNDYIIGIVAGLFTYFLCAYVIQVAYKNFTLQYTSKNLKFLFDKGTLWGIHNVIYFLACLFILFNLVRMSKTENAVE